MPPVSLDLSKAIKLLFHFFIIFQYACYGQSLNAFFERKPVKFSIQTKNIVFTNNYNQAATTENNFLLKVDSIAHSTGIARHFSDVYRKSMMNIALRIQGMNSNSKRFIEKFEISFADYFLKACFADRSGKLSSWSEWNCYFSNPAAEPWQLVLLGVNTHINADLWRSLVDNFSEKEIRQNKKKLLSSQSSIDEVYYRFFETLLDQSNFFRWMNSFTKGLPKLMGERLVYKWRKRNVNLAILYYHDQERFNKKLNLINRKKQNIDKKILNL